MQREKVLGPPKGFRKAIPASVKIDVVIRQEGRCKSCGLSLNRYVGTEFDHFPAIQLRAWDEEAKDTVPPSNDPDFIEAKHADCHDAKTFGAKATGRGSDVTEIARLRRLTTQQEEFRQRILAKDSGDQTARAKPKGRWAKRPFRPQQQVRNR